MSLEEQIKHIKRTNAWKLVSTKGIKEGTGYVYKNAFRRVSKIFNEKEKKKKLQNMEVSQ